jgi:hypothetical protein
MQNAKHNRATISAAERTEVSGRVIALKVNLERFHDRIRTACALVAARSRVYFLAATTVLLVTLAIPAVAQVTFDGAIQGHERGILKGPHNRALVASRELLALWAKSHSPMTFL